MTRGPGLWLAAVCAAAAAALWPLSGALGDSMTGIRAGAALASLVICGAAGLARARIAKRRRLVAGAILVSGAGLAALIAQHQAAGSCIAEYEGKPVIVGWKLQAYVKPEPGATAADLLFDAAGKADRVWTPDSIALCRLAAGWLALLPVPLFAAAACYLLLAYRAPAAAVEGGGKTPPAGAAAYDFFVSYRHTEPDRGFALEIVETLEKSGFRGALDERDFQPNEYVLGEMERCIKQSRFVFCVMTARYLESGFTDAEAVISKTFDMAERKRRVVPLIFERAEMPVWLHGIVGVDFTGRATTDPMDRLKRLLRTRAAPASP
jgi:hypothetical protein